VTPRDLGHGVSIEPRGDDGWRVSSRRLKLPWTRRVGTHPGSAVVWLGEAYEVVAKEVSGSGQGWILQPWSDPEVMRAVFQLDTAWIDAHAATDESHRRGRVLRLMSFPVAPLLALAPARFQRRWRDSWGFPASMATFVSAVLELAAGSVGLVQLLALTFGADWFLPGLCRVFAVIGPVLSADAIVRLSAVAAQAEPVGSILGLPLVLLDRAKRRAELSDRGHPPTIVRTTIVTAVMCIAPRTYQERWARHLGVRPVWFTLLGAGAELVGGWINLEQGATDGGFPTLTVNLYFLVEAVARFALLMSTGRPVGSVLGWIVRPLLARMVPPGQNSEAGD
jgi:hypothetical protein